MSEELKPCPFCGNEASIKDVVVYPNCEKAPAYVGCKNHCAGGSGYDLQDTINRWNNRPLEDALRARIAELGADLEAELDAPPRRDGVCRWTLEDDDINLWQSDCGDAWQMEAGTPSDGHMRFCPFCGKKLEQVIPEKPEEQE